MHTSRFLAFVRLSLLVCLCLIDGVWHCLQIGETRIKTLSCALESIDLWRICSVERACGFLHWHQWTTTLVALMCMAGQCEVAVTEQTIHTLPACCIPLSSVWLSVCVRVRFVWCLPVSASVCPSGVVKEVKHTQLSADIPFDDFWGRPEAPPATQNASRKSSGTKIRKLGWTKCSWCLCLYALKLTYKHLNSTVFPGMIPVNSRYKGEGKPPPPTDPPTRHSSGPQSTHWD